MRFLARCALWCALTAAGVAWSLHLILVAVLTPSFGDRAAEALLRSDRVPAAAVAALAGVCDLSDPATAGTVSRPDEKVGRQEACMVRLVGDAWEGALTGSWDPSEGVTPLLAGQLDDGTAGTVSLAESAGLLDPYLEVLPVEELGRLRSLRDAALRARAAAAMTAAAVAVGAGLVTGRFALRRVGLWALLAGAAVPVALLLVPAVADARGAVNVAVLADLRHLLWRPVLPSAVALAMAGAALWVLGRVPAPRP